MKQLLINLMALLLAAAAHAESTIVINEIMYHPVSDQIEDEYIELFNRGDEPVDLSGWYFSDGIRYSFPGGTILNAGDYLVVAHKAERIREKYNIDNVAGDYIGELSNSGERIALITIDGETADEVEYSDSPPWPAAADEFGPSLECIDPDEDNTRAAAWSVSQGFVDWTQVEAEGAIEGNSLQFYLEEAGSAWLDGVQLFNLDAYKLEEAVWPMEYRHTRSGNQLLNMHFSHIRIPIDPNRRLVRLQLPEEPRIYLFAVTLQLSDRITSSSLSSFFNADGISGPDNLSDGGLDGGGSTYAAELLPEDGILRADENSPIFWELGSYEDGKNNAVQCLGQKISVQRMTGEELHLLAAAVNAQTITESLTIIYADGEEDAAAMQVTDWAVPVPESSSQGIDILKNGSFESGLTTWQTSGNHQTSQTLSNQNHDGSLALHLVATGPGGAEGMVRQTLSGLEAGDRCRLQFWLRAGEGACKVIAETDGGGLHTETLLGSEGTPGRINSVWQETLPPFVEAFAHNPENPTSNDSIAITAQISGGEIIQSVSLQYTVNDQSQWVEMRDDGQSGDGLAQDGVYGATLPPQESQTPVFYSIHAVDALQRTGRSPRSSDPTPRHGYFVYDGEAPSDLPIYFLFVGDSELSRLNSNPNSDDMVEAAVVIDGQVYDGVHVRYRGAWARSWPKKNWKVRFNKGRYYKGWRTSNLNGEYHDRAYMREQIGYDLFEDAGVPHPQCRFVWMQLNGEPFGLYCEIEQPDERFLKRVNREDGSLYKSEGRYNILSSENQYRQTYEKATNEDEPYTALITMIEEVNQISDGEVYNYFVQHFNTDAYIDYLVVNACISNWDSIVKNHFALQDSALTEKWEFIPWDLDRTWGEFPDWNLYSNQDILAGIQGHPGPQLGGDWWNRVQNRFLRNEAFLAAYYNRMRQFLETVFTVERMTERIDAVDAMIRDEVPMEKSIHGSHGSWNYATEVQNMKDYVRDRRDFLFASMPVNVDEWELY